jgi:peptidoglycan/xylan/chitin deacetylase (PgdA/CDA1 family)
MKKILLSVAVLFFIGILTAQAANVSVNLMYDTVANTVSQVANAATAGFRASFFTATSTTQTNTFPLLTTNTATATTICLTGDTCRTTWPVGGAGGTSTVYVSTTTVTTGQVAVITGPGTIGSVATGTISTDSNFTVTANRSAIGGATAIGLASGLTVPTTTGLQTLYASSHNPVTLSGTPNYITLVGQDIVRALINLTSHVTGILGITNGGTGTSTIGAVGTVLVSNGTAYESRATSTLGLSSSAGPVYVSTTTVTTGQGAFISGPGTIGSVATGTLTTSATGLQFDSTRALWGGAAILSLTAGYNIPLTASTTNWNDFYTTPSTRITAGTNLSWSGNTLNATGGGGGANQWSAFTNYIQPATSTDGILVNGSSTIANLSMSRSTTTNATTTSLFVSGSLMTASGTTLNNGGYMKRGNNNQNPIVISEMGTNWGDFYGRGVIAFSSTVYKSGTSSLAITAANTGLNTGARFNIPDYDGSKDNYAFWVRSDNWSQVNTAEFIISTAGTFTDTYTIDLKNFLVAPPNNEWIEIIAPRSNFTRSSAASNWATVNDMLLRITSTNTPTVYVDRLARVKQQNQPMLAVVFDDGWQTQYSAAKPVMDQYAIPGTAYVIWNAVGTAQYMTQSQIDDMHDTGWDIGGHGATNLTTLTPLQVESDLQNMKLYLNQRGYRGAENYAMPNGAYNSSTLPVVQKYFATQRTIDSLSNTSNYINPNRVSAFSPSQFTSTSTLYARVDAAMANNDFVVITFHNIVDTPTLDTDFSTEKFRQFMAYVASSTIKTVTMSAAMNYNDSFATQNDTGMAIGTSTPSASLTIWGNSILTRLFNIFTAAGNAVLTVLSNGSIGVATSSPSALFTVAGDMRLTGRLADSASSTGAVGSVLTATANGTQWLATSSLGITGGGGFSDPLTTNGDIIARIAGATTRLAQGTNGQFLGVSGGVLGYYTPAGGGSQWTTNGTNIYYNTGSVGIGTTTPSSPLTVVGSSTFWGDTLNVGTTLSAVPCAYCVSMAGSDNTVNGITMQVENRNTGAASYSGYNILNDRANSLTSNYAGSFLNSSGFSTTTFGTANAVPYLLQIANVGMGGVSIQSATTSPTFGYINFLTGGTDTTNERMRIASDGKIGIGTTTPSDRLTVAVNNNEGIEVLSTNSAFIGYGKIGADRFRMQNDFTNVGLFEILYNNGAGGAAGTNVFTLTGTGSGIAGRAGVGTTSPSATLAIQNGNTAQAFAISTSTVGTSKLFSVFSTTSLMRHSSALSYFQDNGARVQVGISGYYGRSDTLDTLTVSGTFRQNGWATANCPTLVGATQIATDGSAGCGDFSFYEDGADGTLTATINTAGGYTFGRIVVGTAVTTNGNGSGIFVNGPSAGFLRIGTSTPSFEVFFRPTPAVVWGTTTAMYVGFTNEDSAGTTYETPPTAGCYFIASSTANWLAHSSNGTARTYTDTGIATTSAQWRMGRIDADADDCRFYMKSSESSPLTEVAFHTTNIPTTTDLNAGVHMGRGLTTLATQFDVMHLNLQWRKMLPLN